MTHEIPACAHNITMGRNGEAGSWCITCGEKIFSVETRECSGCTKASKLFDGWVCRKHLMAISSSMRVVFKTAEGSCWEQPK